MTADLRHIAVVGGSLAGLRAAETLRNEGFEGRLTVIGADKNTTIVFPLPMDIVGPLLNALPARRDPETTR